MLFTLFLKTFLKTMRLQTMRLKTVRLKAIRLLAIGSVLASLAMTARGQDEQDSSVAAVDFSRDVLPILSNRCFACHGPDTKEAGLVRLDSFEAATEVLSGGYRAINPDDPSDSELLFRIHSEDDPMPPLDADQQLTDAERAILTRWVRAGGEYEKHWAFVPPAKPAVPDVGEANPIDAFILRRLREQQVEFAPAADRPTLARRAALTLTGLPPDLPLLQSFLNDPAPDAYERYVDQLLASPRFGEHQARYWLDAVRYGDTHGLHLDNRRAIFPYRDWVIDAFNQNLPLDDFLAWQLAGDLLPKPTLAQQVATGFVRMNPTTSEGGVIPAEFQAKNNFDRVETLGTVVMGMTMICARCHTHKYDPITQTEYYQLLAFFNSTAERPLDGNRYDYAPVVKAPSSPSMWTQWRKLKAERDALLAAAAETASGTFAQWTGLSDEDKLNRLAEPEGPLHEASWGRAAANLQASFAELEAKFAPTLVTKELPQPRETRRLKRGEYNMPEGEPLERSVPSVMGSLDPEAPRNRLGLAQWLTSREHPLTSRVLTNQLWLRVFGHGLVRTPEDFGLQGEQPTHPELLDWLAVELQDQRWNQKYLLRLLVTSKTFRQSSVRRPSVDDPANRLWARGPSYRLDAEVIRDIGLWAARLLEPDMGGEGTKPYQPAGLWSALMHPASNTKHYEQDHGDKLYRRSIYMYWKRTSPHPMLTLFDAPSRESSCILRSRTSTPLQSQGLLNETQRVEMARKLAERLIREADSDEARVSLLFQLLSGRQASQRQTAACLALLQRAQQRYSAAEEAAIALLDVGEAPPDPELPKNDVAAWTQVTLTVLASDVAILMY